MMSDFGFDGRMFTGMSLLDRYGLCDSVARHAIRYFFALIAPNTELIRDSTCTV